MANVRRHQKRFHHRSKVCKSTEEMRSRSGVDEAVMASRYPCPDCDERFTARFDLQRHHEAIHLGVEGFGTEDTVGLQSEVKSSALRAQSQVKSSAVGPQSEVESSALRAQSEVESSAVGPQSEVKSSAAMRPCACPDCGLWFTRQEKMHEHQAIIHQGIESKEEMGSLSNVEENALVLQKIKLGKSKDELAYLSNVEESVVPGLFACPVCDKRYTSRSNVRRHHRLVHQKVKLGKSEDEAGLQSDVDRSEMVRGHPCSDCDKWFITELHMQRHYSTIHLGIRSQKSKAADKSRPTVETSGEALTGNDAVKPSVSTEGAACQEVKSQKVDKMASTGIFARLSSPIPDEASEKRSGGTNLPGSVDGSVNVRMQGNSETAQAKKKGETFECDESSAMSLEGGVKNDEQRGKKLPRKCGNENVKIGGKASEQVGEKKQRESVPACTAEQVTASLKRGEGKGQNRKRKLSPDQLEGNVMRCKKGRSKNGEKKSRSEETGFLELEQEEQELLQNCGSTKGKNYVDGKAVNVQREEKYENIPDCVDKKLLICVGENPVKGGQKGKKLPEERVKQSVKVRHKGRPKKFCQPEEKELSRDSVGQSVLLGGQRERNRLQRKWKQLPECFVRMVRIPIEELRKIEQKGESQLLEIWLDRSAKECKNYIPEESHQKKEKISAECGNENVVVSMIEVADGNERTKEKLSKERTDNNGMVLVEGKMQQSKHEREGELLAECVDNRMKVRKRGRPKKLKLGTEKLEPKDGKNNSVVRKRGRPKKGEEKRKYIPSSITVHTSSSHDAPKLKKLMISTKFLGRKRAKQRPRGRPRKPQENTSVTKSYTCSPVSSSNSTVDQGVSTSQEGARDEKVHTAEHTENSPMAQCSNHSLVPNSAPLEPILKLSNSTDAKNCVTDALPDVLGLSGKTETKGQLQSSQLGNSKRYEKASAVQSQKVRTSENLHICELCHATFARACSLKKHIDMHGWSDEDWIEEEEPNNDNTLGTFDVTYESISDEDENKTSEKSDEIQQEKPSMMEGSFLEEDTCPYSDALVSPHVVTLSDEDACERAPDSSTELDSRDKSRAKADSICSESSGLDNFFSVQGDSRTEKPVSPEQKTNVFEYYENLDREEPAGKGVLQDFDSIRGAENFKILSARFVQRNLLREESTRRSRDRVESSTSEVWSEQGNTDEPALMQGQTGKEESRSCVPGFKSADFKEESISVDYNEVTSYGPYNACKIEIPDSVDDGDPKGQEGAGTNNVVLKVTSAQSTSASEIDIPKSSESSSELTAFHRGQGNLNLNLSSDSA